MSSIGPPSRDEDEDEENEETKLITLIAQHHIKMYVYYILNIMQI